LFEFIETKKWVNAFVGFTFVAISMLAKGPLGACVPALALVSQVAYQRRWKVFLWPVWWIGLAYILLLLTPMIYGLIEQYGWIGPRFFFWDQSFGRLTGENVWHNDAGYFFFVHTFLWAFLPWTFFPIVSLWDRFRLLIKTKFQYNPSVELLTYGGFITSFIAFSFSHYKLPHYIFNVFPLAAIFSAASFEAMLNRYKWLLILQKIVLLVAFATLFYLIVYLVPLTTFYIWIGIAVLTVISLYFIFKRPIEPFPSLLLGSATCILAVNLGMNAHFYPTLLTYQSGSNLGNYISAHNIQPQQVYDYNYSSYSEDLYAGAWITPLRIHTDTIKQLYDTHQPFYMVGRAEVLHLLDSTNIPYVKLYQTRDYPVTLLTYKFLDPVTRNSTIDTLYLVKIH
jgi:4-amino-4-deoxy-L-arabinose transferase-like glycosyltransferase